MAVACIFEKGLSDSITLCRSLGSLIPRSPAARVATVGPFPLLPSLLAFQVGDSLRLQIRAPATSSQLGSLPRARTGFRGGPAVLPRSLSRSGSRLRRSRGLSWTGPFQTCIRMKTQVPGASDILPSSKPIRGCVYFARGRRVAETASRVPQEFRRSSSTREESAMFAVLRPACMRSSV